MNDGQRSELLASLLGQYDVSAVFPWQFALLTAMCTGDIPSALDLPTGLGKTSVMAIWLAARLLGAPVPRRLVYVVDRRAVVDQATREAERLRQWIKDRPVHSQSLDLDKGFLPISTLRGQHVDNREWLEDPSKPAIIVGTVDMIGSRLLFEGYGTSRKMRPYHAALLACDTLFVIDEAHLIPPFEALISSIPANRTLHTTNVSTDSPPGMRVLALSATQRSAAQTALSYSEKDLGHPEVAKRLRAQKHLRILPAISESSLRDELVKTAWNLYEETSATFATCIVFCDRRDTAEYVARKLSDLGKKVKADVELFVGARRVGERRIAEKRLSEMGFLAGSSSSSTHPRFLVATSAAEVGVDLDAEHLVGDVVTWERMVQRFGRVNRRGGRPAQVRIVATPPDWIKKYVDSKKTPTDHENKEADPVAAAAERFRATLLLLESLPRLDAGDHNASPLALRELASAQHEQVTKATTPAPLHPALDRATLDAWAMTSLEQHPGRPIVAPWLRGWVEDEPQVTLVWRRFLVPEDKSLWSEAMYKSFVEAAPPQTIETLEIETRRALGWLKERIGAIIKAADEAKQDTPWYSIFALVLNPAGEFVRRLELKDLVTDEKLAARVPGGLKTIKSNGTRLERDDLPNATLLLDARLGGLENGLLADEGNEIVHATADGNAPWLEMDDAGTPVVRFQVELQNEPSQSSEDPDWPERLRLPWKRDAENVTSWLVIKKWRHDAATEDDRSAGREQLLTEHQAWTADQAIRLAKRLRLSERSGFLLAMAARLHDEGKRAARWQRAMRAKKGDVYAKTRGPVNPSVLDGYRHEFGSLTYVEKDAEFRSLSPDEQDLVLHLVAAHHGYARPLISTRGVDDTPPSLLPARARAVTLRYFRLSERWGPWGLAYWESLLRAADQMASRENDAKGAR